MGATLPSLEDQGMLAARKIETTVRPDGSIVIPRLDLPVGTVVEVIVLSTGRRTRPALDILNESPGQRRFKTAEEVDAHIQRERDSWAD